jgi:TfoX/Sxy family transcriptional regulator of competence genes
MNAIPKSDDSTKEYFRSLVPDDPRVEVRPMFGNLAAFVNKNMFLALFGGQVAVRLSEDDGPKLLKEKGASRFAPVAGREMKGYVVLPESWRRNSEQTQEWVQRSFTWASELPPKKPKTTKKKAK